MIVELWNNGELVDKKNKFWSLDIIPSSPVQPTRVFMSNLQTLCAVYHVPKKIILVEIEKVDECGLRFIVAHYGNWYEECIDKLLMPLMTI